MQVESNEENSIRYNMMKTFSFLLLLALLIFSTPASTPLAASTSRLNKLVKKQKKQIKTLTNERNTLSRELAALRTPPTPPLEMVTISEKGNVGDASSFGLGSVPYDFKIGKYEVTVAEYTEFLNAVAGSDTYNLYDTGMNPGFSDVAIVRSGNPGAYVYSVSGSGRHPVFLVNWFDAARFCNWLHNGKPNGEQSLETTEDGAYYLNGAESGVAITRNFGAKFALPTLDEWHKAAYFDPRTAANGGPPGDDFFWTYATQSDVLPDSSSNNPASTNAASWNNLVFEDVGTFASSPGFFGTFDMTGSLFEWTESVNSPERVLKGAAWDTQIAADLAAPFQISTSPTLGFNSFGFRVVSPIEE